MKEEEERHGYKDDEVLDLHKVVVPIMIDYSCVIIF